MEKQIFQASKKKLKILKFFRKYFKDYEIKIVLLVFFEILCATYVLVNPIFLQIFVDRILLNGERGLALFIFIFPIFVYLGYALLTYVVKISRWDLLNKILISIRKDILINMIDMPQAKYEKYETGDLEHIIINDFALLNKMFNEQVIDYCVSCAFIALLIAGMIKINWILFLLSCVIIPVPYIVLKIIGVINYERLKVRRNLYGHYENFIYESLAFWKEIKANSLENYQLRKFLRYRHEIAKNDVRSGYLSYIGDMSSFISEILATRIFLYLVGGIFAMRNTITIGNLLVFISYYESFYKQINKINKMQYEFLNDLPAFEKICEILKKEETLKIQGMNEREWSGNITFSQVSFRYDNSTEDTIKNVSFSVKKGEKVAVVGKNGSGKSTLVKLLCKLYSPQKGNIYVDSQNLNTYTHQEILNSTGVLLQNFSFYNMSIRDNMRLFCPTITDEEIKHALRSVKLKSEIDINIGENGNSLSGGQRQRLAFARVLLKKPSVYIFDEASSALDLESESALLQLIAEHCKQKTVFFITHRKAFLAIADNILVLDKGKVAGFGKHNELMKFNSIYKSLFEGEF